MKKIWKTLCENEMIFYITVLVLIFGQLFLPKSGELVLIDEFFEIFFFWTIFAFVVVKLNKNKRCSKLIRNLIVIAGIALCIWASKNVVLDVIEGPETVTFSNVSVNRYRGTSGILSAHYYLYGTAEGGSKRLEISGKDYKELSNKNSATVTYYKHTYRVVNLR